MITVVDVSGATRSVPIISSPADTQIAPFVGSKDRVLRLQNRIGERRSADGYFVAESDLVIGRAINAGHQLVVCVVHERRSTPLPFAVGSDASVVAITSELAMSLSGTDAVDGSLGLFLRPAATTTDDLLAESDCARRMLVLAGVTNPINMGVIARTAAALGVGALVLDRECVDPFYRRSSRVSMGEVFALRWARGGGAIDTLDRLAGHGFHLAAFTPDDAAVAINDAGWASQDRVAAVFGAEGPGLADEVLRRCDQQVRIPISDRVDSLNVAAAAAIACWELTKSAPSGR